MCLRADDDRAGACFNQGVARIYHLDAIAEKELEDGEGAGRHRMYNWRSAHADFTVRIEPDKFAERRCGITKADDVQSR